MEKEKITLWERFKSNVPKYERKFQLILAGAAASFGSFAAITFPGKLVIINEIAGYIAALCGGAAIILQFTRETKTIIETTDEVKLTSTTTVTTTEVPVEDKLEVVEKTKE